jgi:hypothetical protein
MKVHLNLTSPEQHYKSAMPKALRDLHYGRSGLISLIDHTGCPNNGGQHTLTVSGERQEVVAWLDLFLEQYPETKPEVDILKRNIRREFINSPLTNSLKITLSKFMQQHSYEGTLVSKPWFWAQHWEEKTA